MKRSDIELACQRLWTLFPTRQPARDALCAELERIMQYVNPAIFENILDTVIQSHGSNRPPTVSEFVKAKQEVESDRNVPAPEACSTCGGHRLTPVEMVNAATGRRETWATPCGTCNSFARENISKGERVTGWAMDVGSTEKTFVITDQERNIRNLLLIESMTVDQAKDAISRLDRVRLLKGDVKDALLQKVAVAELAQQKAEDEDNAEDYPF